MKLNCLKSFGLVAALALTATQTAQAQYNPYNPYNPYLNNPYANPAVTAGLGNTYKANFDARFGQIQQQINSAVATGQLSPAQASTFTAQMNNLAAQVNAAYASGALGADPTAYVAQLTSFAEQVTGAINVNTNAMNSYGRYHTYGRRFHAARNYHHHWY